MVVHAENEHISLEKAWDILRKYFLTFISSKE